MPGLRTPPLGFMLELDGVECGLLRSVDGGAISAEVGKQIVGPHMPAKKFISGPRYEPIELEFGFDMAPTLYDWIAATWAGSFRRRSGGVHEVGASTGLTVQRFNEALIASTAIPACDASSKEQAYVKIAITPELIRDEEGSGKKALPTTKPRAWLPSNFKLEIDGLDCARVTKIESFAVKHITDSDPIGEARDYQLEPATTIEFPDLRIALNATSQKSWVDWHRSFVVEGKNGEENERHGSLAFLGPELKSELARINLFNLGIFRLARPRSLSADTVPVLVAELYCERMELVVPKAASPAQPAGVAATPV